MISTLCSRTRLHRGSWHLVYAYSVIAVRGFKTVPSIPLKIWLCMVLVTIVLTDVYLQAIWSVTRTKGLEVQTGGKCSNLGKQLQQLGKELQQLGKSRVSRPYHPQSRLVALTNCHSFTSMVERRKTTDMHTGCDHISFFFLKKSVRTMIHVQCVVVQQVARHAAW